MMRRLIISATLALIPTGVAAQAVKLAGTAQVQVIDYAPDQLIEIEAPPGYQIMIELAPDERVENVAVGDSGAWQVTANKRGDRLFVKPLQQGVSTNMIVVTDTRQYAFELMPLSGSDRSMTGVLRFRYPAPLSAQPPSPSKAAASPGRYKIKGDRQLLPVGMHDDGVHTYIEWPDDRALPAIYAVNDQGRETLANGMMRDGRMVIDSVQRKLVFRVDGHQAVATRMAVKQ